MTMTAEQIEREIKEIDAVEIDDTWTREAISLPGSFAYFGDRPVGVTWSLGPVIITRDSDILAKANHKAMMRELEELCDAGVLNSDDYEITGCSHWACGWVDHFSFKVLDVELDEDDDELPDGKHETTRIAKWVKRWFDALEGYPVADDELYSEMRWEDSLDTLENHILGPEVKLTQVEGQLPEDYVSQIHSELREEIDEHGCWPIKEVREIALEKGWLACEDCEGDGWYMDPDNPFTKPWGGEQNEARKLTCETCKGTGCQPKEEA